MDYKNKYLKYKKKYLKLKKMNGGNIKFNIVVSNNGTRKMKEIYLNKIKVVELKKGIAKQLLNLEIDLENDKDYMKHIILFVNWKNKLRYLTEDNSGDILLKPCIRPTNSCEIIWVMPRMIKIYLDLNNEIFTFDIGKFSTIKEFIYIIRDNFLPSENFIILFKNESIEKYKYFFQTNISNENTLKVALTNIKSGTKINNDYQGELDENDLAHGNGIRIYPSSEKYEGEFKRGLREGYGTFHYPNGNVNYKGYWKNDKYHGDGIIYEINGNISYDGNFKNGYFHGKGKEYLEGIIYYDGNWKEQYKHGFGIEYDEDEKKIYEGNFKNNKRNGNGISYNRKEEKIYEGNWVDNNRHGIGTEFIAGKKYYTGNWKDNNKNGSGIEYNPNGEKIYEGLWEDNKTK